MYLHEGYYTLEAGMLGDVCRTIMDVAANRPAATQK
jgi:hypothetical protein